MARKISTAEFAAECDRRLMDTYELMIHLNLRSRESITKRVKAGTLPAPVLSKPSILSLWDRDAIPTER